MSLIPPIIPISPILRILPIIPILLFWALKPAIQGFRTANPDGQSAHPPFRSGPLLSGARCVVRIDLCSELGAMSYEL